MSGGAAFAQCLAQKLGYPCLAREVIVEEAERLMSPKHDRPPSSKPAIGAWERLTIDRCLYFAAVQSALAQACVSGNLVYHGHSGHMLLKGVPAVLKIRLIAPMAMRIRTVMERQGLDYKEARDYITDIDHERARWTKFVYGADWLDPLNYDLVINLADVDLETACDMAVMITQRPPWSNTEALKKKIADFALACRVKLALAESPESRAICFNATADEGKVEILGEVPGSGSLLKRSGPSEQKLRAIAEKIEGVKEVKVNLRWFAGTEA
jgi:Cytidylate kinase-like family